MMYKVMASDMSKWGQKTSMALVSGHRIKGR
jgi:hypothetical protein